MGMNWDLDFSTETPQQVEDNAGSLPDGWYRAKLADARDDAETGAKKLQFQVTYGPRTNRKITETVKHPRFENDPEKARNLMQRARLFGVRLGVVPRDAKGTISTDYAAALNREFVIKVQSRSFKGDDGKMHEFTSLAFNGVFGLDHQDIPADVRQQLGLPAVAGGAGPSGAAAGTSTSPASTSAAPSAPAPSAVEVAKSLWE